MGKWDTVGFVRHHVNYSTVFAGMDTVWEILTHSIPVKNPRCVAVRLRKLETKEYTK